MSIDVEAVRSRLDIRSIVERHVKLKKVGSSLMGLCPFHDEKSPSFSVSESKQLFYCFGCGKGGDAITFVQEIEGLSFKEAIQKLAEDAGVEPEARPARSARPRAARPSRVSAKDDPDTRAKAKALTRLVAEASRKECPVTLSYLASRGIPDATVRRFWRKRIVGTSQLTEEFLWDIALEMRQGDEDEASKTLAWLKKRPCVFPYRNGDGIVTSAEFRRVGEGKGPKSIRVGKAEQPWVLGDANASAVVVVEGVIDALSYQELHPEQEGAIFAVPGATNCPLAWIESYRQVYLAFDNDPAGHAASLRLALGLHFGSEKASEMMARFITPPTWQQTLDEFRKEHPKALAKIAREGKVKRILPGLGDWNDDLRSKKGLA